MMYQPRSIGHPSIRSQPDTWRNENAVALSTAFHAPCFLRSRQSGIASRALHATTKGPSAVPPLGPQEKRCKWASNAVPQAHAPFCRAPALHNTRRRTGPPVLKCGEIPRFKYIIPRGPEPAPQPSSGLGAFLGLWFWRLRL